MAAPKTIVEAVAVCRPMKVLAFTFQAMSTFALAITLASSAWLEAGDYRQGLWVECSYNDEAREYVTCKDADFQPWLIACGGLVGAGLLCAFIGTMTNASGLQSTRYQNKFCMYKASMYSTLLAVLVMIAALVVFPAMFLSVAAERQQTEWKFAWAYGVSWVAVVLLFLSAILILVDKDVEEIYYRERTIYPDEDGEALTNNVEKTDGITIEEENNVA